MSKTLEQQVEERKQQAKDRQISHKASSVAFFLGGTHSLDNREGRTGERSCYDKAGIRIESESGEVSSHDGSMGFQGLSIKYQGVSVFEEGGLSITTYVPGPWEEELDRLYKKAEAVAKQRAEDEADAARKKEAQKEADTRKNWGL